MPAKSRLAVTRNRSRRIVLASEWEMWKPSSGMIARRFGSIQYTSSASRSSDMGNTPIA